MEPSQRASSPSHSIFIWIGLPEQLDQYVSIQFSPVQISLLKIPIWYQNLSLGVNQLHFSSDCFTGFFHADPHLPEQTVFSIVMASPLLVWLQLVMQRKLILRAWIGEMGSSQISQSHSSGHYFSTLYCSQCIQVSWQLLFIFFTYLLIEVPEFKCSCSLYVAMIWFLFLHCSGSHRLTLTDLTAGLPPICHK